MEQSTFWNRFARHITVRYLNNPAQAKSHRFTEFKLPLDQAARDEALNTVCPCATCGADIHPVRSRAKGGRTATTGHFVSVACDLRTNMGCARSSKATTLLDSLVREHQNGSV